MASDHFVVILLCFQTCTYVTHWESDLPYDTAHDTPSPPDPLKIPCYLEWLHLMSDYCVYLFFHSYSQALVSALILLCLLADFLLRLSMKSLCY